MKIKSSIDILALTGLVLLIYLRNDLVIAAGFAVAIILGRLAAKRFIAKSLHQHEKMKNNDTSSNTTTKGR